MKRGKLLDPFKEQIMETCYNSGTVSIRTNIRTNIRFKTAIRTNIRPNYYYAIRWGLVFWGTVSYSSADVLYLTSADVLHNHPITS